MQPRRDHRGHSFLPVFTEDKQNLPHGTSEHASFRIVAVSADLSSSPQADDPVNAIVDRDYWMPAFAEHDRTDASRAFHFAVLHTQTFSFSRCGSHPSLRHGIK
jgi:hypothetical protein